MEEGAGAPPSWLKIPVIMIHRLRKFFAGAYRKRSFDYSIHRGSAGRCDFRAVGIGWDWPSSRRLFPPMDSLSSRSGVPYVDSTEVLGTPLAETTYAGLSDTLLSVSIG